MEFFKYVHIYANILPSPCPKAKQLMLHSTEKIQEMLENVEEFWPMWCEKIFIMEEVTLDF